MKRLIIQGSSLSRGNTHTIAKLVQEQVSCDLIDLNDYTIGPFDYAFKNQDDDFLPLFRKIVAEYDMLIFATPVYWYSMSGTMKIFFDRISDCLKIDKETGRKLRGKHMAMFSCGSDSDEVPGFEVPFKLSAEYLGMHYRGHVHTWISGDSVAEEVVERVRGFCQRLK